MGGDSGSAAPDPPPGESTASLRQRRLWLHFTLQTPQPWSLTVAADKQDRGGERSNERS
ncbi:MAG: hypothetical protein KKG35_10480 [Proteobacteria bacterium]|nr:hypothetical protein [Pseudomonadota bacterium]